MSASSPPSPSATLPLVVEAFPHLGANATTVLDSVLNRWVETSPIGRQISAKLGNQRDVVIGALLELLSGGALELQVAPPGPITATTIFSLHLTPAGMQLGLSSIEPRGHA
jgi:hypothetical protein